MSSLRSIGFASNHYLSPLTTLNFPVCNYIGYGTF